MPRGRRGKGATGPAAHAQSTLSFNKGSARVTKSSARQDDVSKKAASKISAPAQDQIEEEVAQAQTPAVEEDEAPTTTTPSNKESKEVSITIREPPEKRQAKSEPASSKDCRELEAEAVTDAQLRKYWKAEEDSRLAPRVHQSSLSLHEKILRHFDLSSQYGPCIGIPRLQRWRRANMLGLQPPVEVFAVLLREENEKTSQGCGQLAYVDELAGGRVVLVE